MPEPCDNPRDAALSVIRTLRSAGHTAYLAGGCVRDALLGLTPKDYDVATDATPDTVQQLFPSTAAVGAAFGVVLVYVPRPKRGHTGAGSGGGRHTIEVATFRAEGAYSDGRRPDEVRFTTAEEDAQRRDFTINGLFADPPEDGEGDDAIIDYVGGQADMKAGVIRAVGQPWQRFSEDYLRMLRAVRFAARFSFEIESETAEAIKDKARTLGLIARERIGDEVRRMLMGPNPALATQLLFTLHLDNAIFCDHAERLKTEALERLSPDAAYSTRLSLWMRERTPIRSRNEIRAALMLSNDEYEQYHELAKLTSELSEWEHKNVAERKRLASHLLWTQAVYKWIAEDRYPSLLERAIADVKSFECDGIGLAPDPLVTGDDLIAMGLKPGPDFKTILDQTYDAQLEGQVKSKDEALGFAKDAGK